MSRPENPLNKFRTFSYYFIFGVAESTDKAIEIAKESSNLNIFTQVDPGKRILLDGAKDTRFIIKSVEINSILNPSGAYSGESFYHTMNMEGKIIIQEPLGIRFYEELQNAAKAFNTETTSMVFFLKPIFVGYHTNGSSETISTVKPYLFLITQLTSIVDEGGAIYTLETFGIVNGAGKLQQFQSVAGGFNVEITSEETELSVAFEKLEKALNNHFNNKCKANAEKLIQVGVREGFKKEKIPIEYKFHLDPKYKNGKYIVGTNIDDAVKEISTEKYIIHQGASAGIEELIRKLMNSCEGIVNDRGVDSGGNTAISDRGRLIGESAPTTLCYMYKIHSSLDLSAEKTTLNYYIHKYQVEFVPIENKTLPKPGAVLEFDYIYTGKNIDIKEFQINMKLGTLFFHNTYTSDNLHLNNLEKGKQSVAASAQTGSSGIAIDEIDENKPPRQHCPGSSTPIIDNEARQTPNPVSTGSYYAMLKRFSALENLGIDLVIKGNPNLMDKSVLIPEDLNFGSGVETTGKPLYIHMNIKFPEHFSNPRGNFKKFWYDGAYYILSIKNVFDENKDFSQTIHMYAMHTDYYGDITSKDNVLGSSMSGSSGGYAGGGYAGGGYSGSGGGIVATGDASQAYNVAHSMLGKHENANTAEVNEFLRAGKTGNVNSSSTPWCAGFVNSSLERSGISGTRSLAARSFQNWGNGVSLDQAKQGDVVVFSRGSDPSKGHVGFYHGRDSRGNIMVLGGNQGDAVTIKPYSANNLLSVRRPNAPADYPEIAYDAAVKDLNKTINPKMFNINAKINNPNQKYIPEQLSDIISSELDNIKKLKNEMEDFSSIMGEVKAAQSGISSASQGISSGIGAVQGGIDSIKKEVDRYKGILGGIQEQIQQIEQIKQQAQSMIQMGKNQPIGLAQALNEEYKIMERLNIHPDNIINIINKKAPVLSETWKTAEEAIDMVKEQYAELQSTYNEVRSLYEQISNLPADLKNQAGGLINQVKGFKL
jgi:uncharacterized protein (TIGR02594 family)